ncbi:phosphoribosyl-AMP cyclohydrolase [Thermaurantiacus sp.]
MRTATQRRRQFPADLPRALGFAAGLLAAMTSADAAAARNRSGPAPAPARCITEKEVIEAQRAWGDGIVEIGKVYAAGGDYVAAAANHINRFYGYDQSLVLFKPTLAAVEQFRLTFDAALSYFVGQNPSFPEDRGFAVRPWSKVRWKNTGIVNNSCNMAVAMGNYWFTPAAGGPETKVEYTFGYVRGPDEALRIVVHHSSVPYPEN